MYGSASQANVPYRLENLSERKAKFIVRIDSILRYLSIWSVAIDYMQKLLFLGLVLELKFYGLYNWSGLDWLADYVSLISSFGLRLIGISCAWVIRIKVAAVFASVLVLRGICILLTRVRYLWPTQFAKFCSWKALRQVWWFGNCRVTTTHEGTASQANLARAIVTNTCSIHCRKITATDELCELICIG